LLILPVSEYSALDTGECVQVKDFNWQAIIRYGNAVRRECLLPIGAALHGS
jgi:hypothetical protein